MLVQRNKISALLLLILIGFVFSLPLAKVMAQTESELSLENKKYFRVDEILVEGMLKIEKEAILKKINTKVGEVVSANGLRDDIKSIYGMRFFDSVEVFQRTDIPGFAGKNFLVFKVVERPIIKKISYQGNSEISTDDIKEKVKTKEFGIIDINSIKNDIKEIEKFYEEKGYYLVNVKHEIKSLNKENVEVIFHIKEFEKVKVKKITILGNREIKDDELKGIMLTREDSLLSFMNNSGNFKDFNFKTDIERVKYYYKNKGYLQINVNEPIVTVSEDKRWLFISFSLQEGPKFSVNKVRYEGDMLFPQTKLKEITKLKEEETYSEQSVQEDVQALTELYQDEGYAFTNVMRSLDIVPGENKVDVTYSFEKGKIVYFGKIIMKGNTKTRDKVIRRELLVKEGMRFSGSKLRESKENVERLGFFEPQSVVFNTINSPTKDDVLDLEISIKERTTGQIQVGAGYSSGSHGFLQASISQNNFLGRGQELSFSLNLSKKTQVYSVGFQEPYLLDSKWTAGSDVYYSVDKDSASYNSRIVGGDARLGYPIFDYTKLFLTYKVEHTKMTEIRNPLIDPSVDNGTSSSVETKLMYDRRNNRYETTDGKFTSLAYEYTGVGGSQFYAKSEFDARFFKNVWGDLVFRSHFVAEKLFEREKHRIPFSKRLQLGGPRSLRGYYPGSIAPTAQLADPITGVKSTYTVGGQFSVLGTLEFEHPLVKEAGLKWVVFFDAGNVYERYMGHGGDYALRSDYGFGFRWFSPIGPLRFEFGYPINKREGEDDRQFHFDIGQPF